MAVNSYASYGDQINVNKLTKLVREVAQPMKAFSQASQPGPGDAIGLKEGDTGQYTTVGDVDTEGGEISENERMPATGITPKKITYTLREYGNSIDFTSKLTDLSFIDVDDKFIRYRCILWIMTHTK